jgi:hypothetical protein
MPLEKSKYVDAVFVNRTCRNVNVERVFIENDKMHIIITKITI